MSSDPPDYERRSRRVRSRFIAQVTTGSFRMSGQPLRVLIIDDYAPFRSLARELMERRGFEVVGEADRASSGRESCRAGRARCLLLDVRLPDGNGFEVCRALTGANPSLKVLIVSADAHHPHDANKSGAVGFLPKSRLPAADLVDLLRGGAQEDRKVA